jgi:hypothetical protein
MTNGDDAHSNSGLEHLKREQDVCHNIVELKSC